MKFRYNVLENIFLRIVFVKESGLFFNWVKFVIDWGVFLYFLYK